VKKKEFAAALRKRQLRLGRIPKCILDGTTDEEIIDAYMGCPCCGKPVIDSRTFGLLIEEAKTADEALVYLKRLRRLHLERVHGRKKGEIYPSKPMGGARFVGQEAGEQMHDVESGIRKVSVDEIDINRCREAAAVILSDMRAQLTPEEAFVVTYILGAFFRNIAGYRISTVEDAGKILRAASGILQLSDEITRKTGAQFAPPGRDDNRGSRPDLENVMYG